ncbi:MAG: hypothetical protein JWO66_2414, partial [Candidatus Eremiobacteraeota bacterium]|nr:hypothetical protein [Candidatus Eremiobacteraeota bacterium]
MNFTAGVAEFTAVLREEHRFGAGHAATRDALRAAEIVGIGDAARLRHAFRAVYCASPDEAARFDDAFDAFFLGARGITQPNLRSRHTRHGHELSPAAEQNVAGTREERHGPGESDEGGGRAAERRPVDDAQDAAATWQALRARYSPAAA